MPKTKLANENALGVQEGQGILKIASTNADTLRTNESIYTSAHALKR